MLLFAREWDVSFPMFALGARYDNQRVEADIMIHISFGEHGRDDSSSVQGIADYSFCYCLFGIKRDNMNRCIGRGLSSQTMP